MPDIKNNDDKKQPKKTSRHSDAADMFWLTKVFPVPSAIFSTKTPRANQIFDDAIVALDANILLAPYQVSKQSFDEISAIYRRLTSSNRLYVPEQACREFAKNKGLKLIDVHKQLNNFVSKLHKPDTLDCPMLQGNSHFQDLKSISAEILDAHRRYLKAANLLKKSLTEWSWSDVVSDLYCDIFTADNIVSFDLKESDFRDDLQWRCKHKVPPGYNDENKIDSGMGDLAIWYTLINLGKTKNKAIIFVTNERKNDWVYKSDDSVLAPRTELVLEFQRETGNHFDIIDWSGFLELAGAKNETIEEANKVESMEQNDITLGGEATTLGSPGVLHQLYAHLNKAYSLISACLLRDAYIYLSLFDSNFAEVVSDIRSQYTIARNYINSQREQSMLHSIVTMLININEGVYSSLNRNDDSKETRINRHLRLVQLCNMFLESWNSYKASVI